MYVDLTVEPAQLRGVDVFTELWVLAESGMTEPEVRAALDSWGHMEGEHVWLRVAVLLREGQQDDSAWRGDFDKMVDYAKSAGWTRGEPDSLRAHIVRRPSTDG